MQITDLELEKLKQLVQLAGDAIVEVYHSDDFGVEHKTDDSPVTRADTTAHTILVAGLELITPNIPIVSEEDPEQETGKTYWLVDPLDGTKNFINKEPEFVTMIALIVDEQPVFGMIYAPILRELYWGDTRTKQAFQQLENNPPTAIAPNPQANQPLRVTLSKTAELAEAQSFIDQLPTHEIMRIGSALKFCRVAIGDIDAYVRFHGTYEWDTAAGEALCRAAEVNMFWLDADHHYGRKNRLNGGFICANSNSGVRPH